MEYQEYLKAEIEKYKYYAVIVEGKKDVASLEALGFVKVQAIHSTGVPLRERVEQIINNLEKKDKVCILTDFDKKGKQLYLMLKKEFGELGARIDSTLRGVLLKSGVSQIEGLYDFMRRNEQTD